MSLDVLAQISSKTSQQKALQDELPALVSAELEWRVQSQVACKYSTKSKQDACLADRAYKKGQADYYKSRIDNINTQVAQLERDISALKSQLAADQQSQQTLASQGLSANALEIEATGKATAAKVSAQTTAKGAADAQKIVAAAEAQKIAAESATDAERSKMITYVGFGIGAVVVIIIAVIVWKRVQAARAAKAK